MQGIKDSLVLVSVGGVERNNLGAYIGILRHFSSVMLFRENGRVIVDIEDVNFQLCKPFNIIGIFSYTAVLPSNASNTSKSTSNGNLSVNRVMAVCDAYVEQIR